MPIMAIRRPLEYSAVAIRDHHDVGNTANMRAALALLAVFADRLGRYEPATTRIRLQSPHRNVGSRDQHRDHPSTRCVGLPMRAKR